MRKKLKIFLWISLLPHWIFIEYIKSRPLMVEEFYSQKIYPLIYKTYSFFFDKIPFSIGDIIYLLTLFLIFKLIIKYFKNYGYSFFKLIFDLGALLSGMILLFNITWGINYYRLPLNEKLNIKTIYTQKDLEEKFDFLINKANELHISLSGSDSLPIKLTNKKDLLKISLYGYDKFSESEIFKNSIRKKSLFSTPLSYIGFSGYINPFTLEGQINSKTPYLNLIISDLHEAAHQMGYASEKEANFIAYFFSYINPDPYVKYASLIFAIRYLNSALYDIDPKKAKEKIIRLNYGIIENIKNVDSFWRKYKNPFQPIFKSSYDKFLKANSQEKGIKSYNEVVGLIINYKF